MRQLVDTNPSLYSHPRIVATCLVLVGALSAPGATAQSADLLAVFNNAGTYLADTLQNSVSTSMFLYTMPNASFSLEPVVGAVTVSVDECPTASVDAVNFLSGIVEAWNDFVDYSITAAVTGSAQIAATPQAMAGQVANVMQPALSGTTAGLTGGAGAGFGFSVQCSGVPVFTFGGGSGGGVSSGSAGFGGGAGGQVQGMSVGGGGGCACSGTTCTGCGANQDVGAVNSLKDFSSVLMPYFTSCPDNLWLCGSGGGGGGVTYPGCQYGAGYSVSFAAQIYGDDGVAMAAKERAAKGRRDQVTCSPDTEDALVSAAVAQCTAKCAAGADFNGCYCPCFSSTLASQGVVWALAMNCN